MSGSRRDGFFGQHLQDIAGVGAVSVVDIRVGVDDRAIAVDNVSCGYLERPFARRPIAGRNIQIEAVVGLLELFGELVNQAECTSDFWPRSLSTSNLSAFFSTVDSVSSGFSGLIATSDAPAAAISGSIS